jgi:polar amino acid transport system ATP-binding protein
MRLELRGVSIRFGDQVALNDIRADIDFGHTLALIGPSGGGKSTLLRLLAGLITPDEGEILIDGSPIPTRPAVLRLYRSTIGTVFQSFNLFPHLTALENITLPLVQVHRLSPAQALERARAVIDRFQLSAHALKRPAALSGGQRQRIAIARAVAIQPRFLLLDEPTSALDPEMTAEVLDLLSELREEGRTIILVTHQMGFAREAADQVAFLTNGTLRAIDIPSRLFGEGAPAEVRQFLLRVLRY